MITQKNNSDITAEATSIYSQTDPKSIKGSVILEFLKNLFASFLNKIDDAKLLGVREHDETKPFKAGELTVKNGRIGRAVNDTIGVADDSTYEWLTPKNLLFELTEWNSAPKAIGTLVRYQNKPYVNLVVDNTDNPLDYGYTGINVPKCYYGESYLSNSVYIAGMVVLANVDSRMVYLRCNFVEITLSADIKAEWNAGDWEFVGEAKPSSSYLIIEDYTLKNSDHGKVFNVEEASITISMPFLNESFHCKIISTSATCETGFAITEGGTMVSLNDYTKLVAKGVANIQYYGTGFRHLSGDLVPSE